MEGPRWVRHIPLEHCAEEVRGRVCRWLSHSAVRGGRVGHVLYLEQRLHGLREVVAVALAHEVLDVLVRRVLVALQLVLTAPEEQMQTGVAVLVDGRDQGHAYQIVEAQLLLDLLQGCWWQV